MKQSSPAISLYFVASFLYLLSIFFESENMALFFKPMIASSMLFYYWQEARAKTNVWFSVVIILLLITGILNIFEDEFVLFYIILINMLAYTMLLSFSVRSLLEIKFNLIDRISIVFIFIMTLFISSLIYVAVFLVFGSSFELYILVIIYAVILGLLAIVNTVKYLMLNNKGNFYSILTTFCFIVCDLFYILYYYYYDFIFFRYTSILSNVISLYFLVKYFLFYKKKHFKY
ncbi:hypothetical protein [Flavobacterium sp.]|uniref:hypothetical protein n=1 Tax=Flavobacterium sp. TaxID=239 RepID=UPI00286D6C2E|nr:hypothetical protein [Flavobacterium sp.]